MFLPKKHVLMSSCCCLKHKRTKFAVRQIIYILNLFTVKFDSTTSNTKFITKNLLRKNSNAVINGLKK